MRKLFALVMVLGALLCCSAMAFAGSPAPPVHHAAALSVDPYLGASTANTVVPMVPKCLCRPFAGCAYQPIGFDCGDTPHCCSCQGVDPATRMCVGVPS